MRFLLLLLVLLSTGCSSLAQEDKGSAITVGYRDVNGVRYIATSELIENIGKEVPSKDSKTPEFFEIPGRDPSQYLALKQEKGYVKLIRKDIWCASPQASDPALQKAGQCKK